MTTLPVIITQYLMENIILKLKKSKGWIDLILVASIILITFFTWKGILNQSIEGEGFYYFVPPISNSSLKGFLTSFDNMPRAFTFVSGLVFGGKMQGYMTSQLIVIILLAVCEYFIIKAVAKSRLIALMATLYFTVNSSSNFQLYARGHFQWFTQRVFELFPFLFSSLFLSKFFNYEKYRYYLLSFLFFLIALLTSTYTTLLLPFYPSFLFVMAITKKAPINKRILYLLLCLPFILVNYVIVKNSSLGEGVVNPANTYLPLFKQLEEYIFKVSHQLVAVTLPLNILTLIARTFNSAELKIIINAPLSSITIYSTTISIEALKMSIMKLAIPVYLFYASIIWFLYKKKSPQFHIVFTLFLALIGDLFLSAYTNRFDVYNAIFESRYFYLPSFFVGIIFACFIYNLIPNKLKGRRVNFFKLIFIFFLLSLWIIINFKLINVKVKGSQYKYTAERVMLNYLTSVSGKFPENSIVVLPDPLMPGAELFLGMFYNNSSKTVKYYNLNGKWQKDIPDNYNLQHLYVFTYSDEIKRGGNAQLNKIHVIDVSDNFRKQLTK